MGREMVTGGAVDRSTCGKAALSGQGKRPYESGIRSHLPDAAYTFLR